MSNTNRHLCFFPAKRNQISLKRPNQLSAEIPTKQIKIGANKKQIKRIKKKIYSRRLPPLVVPDNKYKRKNLDNLEGFNEIDIKRMKTEHLEFPSKRKSESQLNIDKKRHE